MNYIIKNRDSRLDIIRIFALFCVISVHFFLKNGYYSEIIQGETLYISTIVRSFFMICVPLFIILSGYLMNKKEPNKKYFIAIKKVVIQYLICSTIIYFFNMFYYGTSFSIYNFFFGMFNYSNAPYSWYVEMYIGLYLLIPFLNVIYNNLKNKKQKKSLIFVLIIITILPSIGMMFNFKNINIVSSKFSSQKLLPAYWVNFYPVTYYFVGCYLREYEIKISKLKNIVYVFISTLIFGIVSVLVNYNNYFSWNLYQDYCSLFVFIITVLVFILLLNINLKNRKLAKFLAHASDSVFCAYLLSYIFDTILYNLYFKNILEWPKKFVFMPLAVFSVFACSLFLSMIIMYVIKIFKSSKFKVGDINGKI